jgi:hypothetical protein
VARFWRTTPMILKLLPEIEFKRLREYALRSIEGENKAIESAQMGARTPGRGNPKPGDTIVERKRGQRDIDDDF